MEIIDALQAIERGEKQDQETLLRLKDEGLVDLADVTHMQSPGQEFIFVGFTAKGLGLLKDSKLLLLSDPEKEITRIVARTFLDQHQPTTTRTLLRHFKSPISSALQRLGNLSVIKVVNNTYLNETYLPRASAFYHCGDPAALAFARKSTEIVLRVLRDLFDRELDSDSKDHKQFTREEVEKEARAIDSSVEPNMVFTGLYLAQEFSIFSTIKDDDQHVGIVSFSLTERVYDTDNMDWDQHIRLSIRSLVYDWEQAHTALPTAIPSPPELFNSESYASQGQSRKVFLVHGHAEEPKQAVAAFLRSLGLEVVILHEQANRGLTIIEKFEKHSDVRFTVVLLTPDDVGASVLHPEKTRRRARQNVILELGYFLARLGRNNVCCLYVEGVESPSDYDGVLYVPYDEGGAWQSKLITELSAAGIEVDIEKPSKGATIQNTVDAIFADVTMIARKGGPVRFPR
jgi:Predicted nucleotide-binding protein containing TIR-like domain